MNLDEAPIRYVSDEKLQKDAAIDSYVMSWVCVLIPGRLLIGPFPTNDMDIIYLVKKHRVENIVNILPETAVKTKSGMNKASWYTMFFGNDYIAENPRISLLREPLPEDFSKLNETQQNKCYMEMATRVTTWMRERPAQTFYIHYRTGFDEEAFLAFVVWAMLDKATVPRDVGVWLSVNNYDQLLQAREEDRIALTKVVKQVLAPVVTITSMFKKQRV